MVTLVSTGNSSVNQTRLNLVFLQKNLLADVKYDFGYGKLVTIIVKVLENQIKQYTRLISTFARAFYPLREHEVGKYKSF